ncbi:sec-independent protein translocase protein TatB [Sphingomonas zeicaulis]|uniref:Sec-independent protein translocase protein TatB n=1 Tax=Sphingomonas zeicaulis TaxID=1632740 RepID=UPI003D2627DD
MFDVAPTELLLVAFVALIVIGPKDLPKAMRVVGYWVGRARGVARQFRSGFDAMVREAELEEMEKKWKEENERIMREHSAATSFPELDDTTPQQQPLALTADPVPDVPSLGKGPSLDKGPSLEKAEDSASTDARGDADAAPAQPHEATAAAPSPATDGSDAAPPPPAPEERPYWLDKQA